MTIESNPDSVTWGEDFHIDLTLNNGKLGLVLNTLFGNKVGQICTFDAVDMFLSPCNIVMSAYRIVLIITY